MDMNTPDTDANVWSDSCEGILCKVVSAEFARRLERERDEARIDAQKSKAYKRILKETNLRQTERIRYLEGATNHACGTPLSVALRERDEAREKYATEATEHMLAVNKLCNERDEARDEIKRLKVILDLIKKDVS
jgi:hypothetical protein